VSFDYGNTCPDIDKSIGQLKDAIAEYVEEIITEFSPRVTEKEMESDIKSYAEAIYDEFETSFEAVRSTNEDMRKAAENQIDTLEDEKCYLESELLSLKNEVENLELA